MMLSKIWLLATHCIDDQGGARLDGAWGMREVVSDDVCSISLIMFAAFLWLCLQYFFGYVCGISFEKLNWKLFNIWLNVQLFPNVVTDSGGGGGGHPLIPIWLHPLSTNHRVGLKFVIASVTPCVITQRAGCHCVRVIAAIAPVCHRIPHAIYHIAICTRLYYIQCFIVWRLAGQTYRLHDTVILRI